MPQAELTPSETEANFLFPDWNNIFGSKDEIILASKTEIQKKQEGIRISEKCVLCENGLEITGDLEYNEWLPIGSKLVKIGKGIMWAIGDWLAYGQAYYTDSVWGKRLPVGLTEKVAEATGMAEGTISCAKYVCSKIPRSIRNEKLTFSHYNEIACRCNPSEIEMWADRSAEKNYSVRALREQIRLAKKECEFEPDMKGVSTIVFKADQFSRDYMNDSRSGKINRAMAKSMLETLKPVFEDLVARTR